MPKPPYKQRGAALLLFLLLGFGIGATIFFSVRNGSPGRLEQERTTLNSLNLAKQALIAYAVAVYPSGNVRPGDLPCPDTNDDGVKESSCGNASGSTGQTTRLGRLPWKSLGLPDLRDSSGERLWYAVSNNFKEDDNKSRHLPLNSDTTGSIRYVDSDGNVVPNVIAVIIAPGSPIQRLNTASVQNRSAAGTNNPTNYLDATANEDNADFVDYGPNGFANGIVRDNQGRILVNDMMTVITYNDLLPLLEKKVAATVLNCLNRYASYVGSTSNNMGRYPWPASMATSAANNYDDTPNTLFGRVPDIMLNSSISSPNMLPTWGALPECSISDNWFRDNWREQVFYAIADAYKPGATPPACGACLTVGTKTNARVAVIMARRALSAASLIQRSTAKSVIGNYLEDGNATAYDGVFEDKSISASFNDLLVYK